MKLHTKWFYILMALNLLLSAKTFCQTDHLSKANAPLRHYILSTQSKTAQEPVCKTSVKSQGLKRRFLNLFINTHDTIVVKNWLQLHGGTVTTTLPNALTARIADIAIDSLTLLPEVDAVSGLNNRKPFMNMVREYTNADIAIEGKGFYAPYTGKNVVIGIIDQGFQYVHPAFRHKDGTSRIISAWQSDDEGNYKVLNNSQQIIEANDDGMPYTHGTEVTGIAAGGYDLADTQYYGIAPNADIVTASSPTLSDAEIIDAISHITSVAKKKNEPCVINMSFGTMATTHNGKNQFSDAIDKFGANSAILVAAIGNDGDQTKHIRLTLGSKKDSALLYAYCANKNLQIMLASHSKSPFKANVYYYNVNTGKLTYISPSQMNNMDSSVIYSFEPLSGQATAFINLNNLRFPNIVISVSGWEGQTIDAWTTDDNEFSMPTNDSRFKFKPDNAYCISSPAEANTVIGVSSYCTRKFWKSLDGSTYQDTNAAINAHASYASLGPLVEGHDETNIKPTVTAPGSCVITSASDKDGFFTSSTSKKPLLAAKTFYGGQPFYYAVSNGTSMASPVVAGTIAIWLEAAPDLTYSDIKDILARTSHNDSYTQDTPNDTWGYGKIDVYEGLKDALSMSAIPSTNYSATPFSIQSYNDHWAVLLNNDELSVRVRLVDLNGKTLYNHTEHNTKRGHEVLVPTSSLGKGVYILLLQTPNNRQCRKIIVA